MDNPRVNREMEGMVEEEVDRWVALEVVSWRVRFTGSGRCGEV